MNLKKIVEFKDIFEGLVDYVNCKHGIPGLYFKDGELKNKYENNKYICITTDELHTLTQYIYQIIKKYCEDNKINFNLSYFPEYIYIRYSNEIFKTKKIYSIFCSFCYANSISIIKKEEKIDNSLIINFEDIINYYLLENKKEQLGNIKKGIIELQKQGITQMEIESEIKKILHNEKNAIQKVKTPQK